MRLVALGLAVLLLGCSQGSGSENPPASVQVKTENLCLFLQMPNGKVRMLSQQANVKVCKDIYKSAIPDSLKPKLDPYAYKSTKFAAILLKDWTNGWRPGRDTANRKLQLY